MYIGPAGATKKSSCLRVRGILTPFGSGIFLVGDAAAVSSLVVMVVMVVVTGIAAGFIQARLVYS